MREIERVFELSAHICLTKEHSVWQVLPSSHATRALHYPAVWLTARASQHQQHRGRGHSSHHPVTAGHYMTCLHTTGTSIHDLHRKPISISCFSVWEQQRDTGCYLCWFNIVSINISKKTAWLVILWTNPLSIGLKRNSRRATAPTLIIHTWSS